MTRIKRRKMVPSSWSLTATEGASWPSSAPASKPTRIHPVSERREVAYAAISAIASQRRRVGKRDET